MIQYGQDYDEMMCNNSNTATTPFFVLGRIDRALRGQIGKIDDRRQLRHGQCSLFGVSQRLHSARANYRRTRQQSSFLRDSRCSERAWGVSQPILALESPNTVSGRPNRY